MPLCPKRNLSRVRALPPGTSKEKPMGEKITEIRKTTVTRPSPPVEPDTVIEVEVDEGDAVTETKTTTIKTDD